MHLLHKVQNLHVKMITKANSILKHFLRVKFNMDHSRMVHVIMNHSLYLIKNGLVPEAIHQIVLPDFGNIAFFMGKNTSLLAIEKKQKNMRPCLVQNSRYLSLTATPPFFCVKSNFLDNCCQTQWDDIQRGNINWETKAPKLGGNWVAVCQCCWAWNYLLTILINC